MTRRKLEVARNDVVRQVTAIVAEKDCLEKEVNSSNFTLRKSESSFSKGVRTNDDYRISK